MKVAMKSYTVMAAHKFYATSENDAIERFAELTGCDEAWAEIVHVTGEE